MQCLPRHSMSLSVFQEYHTTIANVNYQYIQIYRYILFYFMPNYLWLVGHIAPHNVLCCMHPHRKVLLVSLYKNPVVPLHFDNSNRFFSGSSLFLSAILHTLFNTFFYPSFYRFTPSSSQPPCSSHILYCALVSVFLRKSIKCLISV